MRSRDLLLPFVEQLTKLELQTGLAGRRDLGVDLDNRLGPALARLAFRDMDEDGSIEHHFDFFTLKHKLPFKD